jgi:hypothetical protein
VGSWPCEVLIKYARLLAWLLCRDLLDSKTTPEGDVELHAVSLEGRRGMASLIIPTVAAIILAEMALNGLGCRKAEWLLFVIFFVPNSC